MGWPLRYSHSPAEVIDLKDLVSLADIVRAVAEDVRLFYQFQISGALWSFARELVKLGWEIVSTGGTARL